MAGTNTPLMNKQIGSPAMKNPKTYFIAMPSGKNRKVRGLLVQTKGSMGEDLLRGEIIIARVGENILTEKTSIDVTNCIVTVKG